MAPRNDIISSPINDEFNKGKYKTLPAIHHNAFWEREDGTAFMTSPMQKLAKAYTKDEGVPIPDEFNVLAEQMPEILTAGSMEGFPPYVYRTLSIKEVVQGVEGTNIRPINLSSSGGAFFHYNGIKSREDCIDRDTGRLSKVLYDEVIKQENFAKKGVLYAYPALALFKSETLAEEFVNPPGCTRITKERYNVLPKEQRGEISKCRVYYCLGLPLLINCMRYLGHFCAFANQNIGTHYTSFNPHGVANKILIEKLTGYKSFMFNDISGNDNNMHPGVTKLSIEASLWERGIAKGTDEYEVCKTFMMAIHGLPVQFDNMIVRMMFVIFSGHLETIRRNCEQLNCMFNTIAYCLYPNFPVRSFYTTIFCGDDSIVGVREGFSDFNKIHLGAVMKSAFGLPMTNADKSEITEKYDSIENGYDLASRMINFNDSREAVARLKKESIYGMLCWIRTSLPVEEAISQNIDAALLEAVYYGEKFFNKLRNRCDAAMRKAGIKKPIRNYVFFKERFNLRYTKGTESGIIDYGSVAFQDHYD